MAIQAVFLCVIRLSFAGNIFLFFEKIFQPNEIILKSE